MSNFKSNYNYFLKFPDEEQITIIRKKENEKYLEMKRNFECNIDVNKNKVNYSRLSNAILSQFSNATDMFSNIFNQQNQAIFHEKEFAKNKILDYLECLKKKDNNLSYYNIFNNEIRRYMKEQKDNKRKEVDEKINSTNNTDDNVNRKKKKNTYRKFNFVDRVHGETPIAVMINCFRIIMKKIFHANLFGNSFCEQKFFKLLKQYLNSAKTESVSMREFVRVLIKNIKYIEWLQQLSSVEAQSILHDLIKWLFKEYFFIIMVKLFHFEYVSNKRRFFFRSHLKKEQKMYFEGLEKKNKIISIPDKSDSDSSQRVVNKCKFLPKRNSLRLLLQCRKQNYAQKNASRKMTTFLNVINYTIKYKRQKKKKKKKLRYKKKRRAQKIAFQNCTEEFFSIWKSMLKNFKKKKTLTETRKNPAMKRSAQNISTARGEKTNIFPQFFIVISDIENAFGSILRNKLRCIIEEASQHLPEIIYLKPILLEERKFGFYNNANRKRKHTSNSPVKLSNYSESSVLYKYEYASKIRSKNHTFVRMKKEEFLQAVALHFDSNKFIYKGKMYELSCGVGQGLSASPILSEIYYNDMRKTTMMPLINSGYYHNYVDDSIFITCVKKQAQRYIHFIKKRNNFYGTIFNKDKLQTNLIEHETSDKESIKYFYYLGFRINAKNLEIEPAYKISAKFSVQHLDFNSPYSYKRNLSKTINQQYLKLDKNLLSIHINRPKTIRRVIRAIASRHAEKYTAILKSVIFDITTEKTAAYFNSLECVNDELCTLLIKSSDWKKLERERNSILQIIWKAILTSFKKRRTYFECFIRIIEDKIICLKVELIGERKKHLAR